MGAARAPAQSKGSPTAKIKDLKEKGIDKSFTKKQPREVFCTYQIDDEDLGQGEHGGQAKGKLEERQDAVDVPVDHRTQLCVAVDRRRR